MENLKRELETSLAYNKMSPEQIRLTENRIMTFGFGPENFVESAGYSQYSFDGQKEAPAIKRALAGLNAIDLKVLLGELLAYGGYLSSPAGKLATFEGKKPALEKDGVGHFGVAQRANFLIRAIREEMAKQKLGFWNTLHLVPKALGRLDGIRREAGEVRRNKELEDERSASFGDEYLDAAIEALDPPPLGEEERKEMDALLKALEEKHKKARGELLKALDEQKEKD